MSAPASPGAPRRTGQERSGAATASEATMAQQGKMSRQRERAVTALLLWPTIAEAAQDAGVSERTMRRWLSEPNFLAEFGRARREALALAVSRLEQASGIAVTKLVELLGDDDTKVVLRAAVSVLSLAVKGNEMLDLAARL